MGNRDRKLSPKVQKPSSKQKNSICPCVALVFTRCTGVTVTGSCVFGHKPFCTLEINLICIFYKLIYCLTVVVLVCATTFQLEVCICLWVLSCVILFCFSITLFLRFLNNNVLYMICFTYNMSLVLSYFATDLAPYFK